MFCFPIRQRKTTVTMDESQKEAFEYACETKLAIIQGPPGCGKTYIGVKLAQFLMTILADQPILVLTYKNHALDEFLKHMIPICGLDNLIRIGLSLFHFTFRSAIRLFSFLHRGTIPRT